MQTKTIQSLFPPGKRAGLIYQFVYAIKRTRAEDDICGFFCVLVIYEMFSVVAYKIILKGDFWCLKHLIAWAFVQNISFSNKYIGL